LSQDVCHFLTDLVALDWRRCWQAIHELLISPIEHLPDIVVG